MKKLNYFTIEDLDYLTREIGINIVALANMDNAFSGSKPLTIQQIAKLAYDAGWERGRRAALVTHN